MQFIYIGPIDRTVSGATTPGLSGLWSDGKKEVVCIPQSSSITSLLDCLVSIQDTRSVEVLLPCIEAVGIFYCPSRY